MRIALVSTPRSGNGWLRQLLAALYEIPGQAVANPARLDWAALPVDCVLGFHWPRDPALEALLKRHGFRTAVVARHPCDVLVSVLQVCLRSPASGDWLNDPDKSERSIFGAMPRSQAFLDYATGPRAASLLTVSRAWWRAPGCRQVRYEALRQDTAGELLKLTDAFGVRPKKTVNEALTEVPLARLRLLPRSRLYFWQGWPGFWKRLLTTAEAEPIAGAHPACFTDLEYPCDPNPKLDARQADRNWLELLWADMAEDLHQVGHAQEAARHAQEALAGSLPGARGARATPVAEELGPLAIQVARRIHRISRGYPRLSSTVKRIFRLTG